MDNNLWRQVKYANLLSSQLRNFKKKSNGLYNFSCPLCGDSRKNTYKARAYFYSVKNVLSFKCFNCSRSISFENFLRQQDPILYKQYKFENFSKNNIPFVEEETPLVIEQIADWMAGIVPAKESSDATEYLKGRQIGEEHWDRFFYTDDLNLVKGTFTAYQGIKFVEEPRLVIPVFSQTQTFLGFITRAIFPSKLRYVNLKKKSEEPFIFNLDRVDLSKQVLVFEGSLDSLFLPNSIAVDGADFKKASDFIQKERDVLVYDNTPRNVELLKIMERSIEADWKVCIWPESIPEKDINEMVKAGRTPTEIHDVILNHSYNGLRAKLEFAKWKKR